MKVKNQKRGASRKPVRQARQPVKWSIFLRHSAAFLFVMVTVFGGAYLYQDDTLPILHVTVDGDFHHVDREAFVAAVTPHATGSFMTMDVATLREAGEAQPWIKQLQIRKVWPDSLHFIVKEHDVLAQWKDNGLVSTTGTLFYPSKKSFPEGLAVLAGPDKNHIELAKQYVAMSETLSKYDLAISRLDMDARKAWSVELANGLTIKLGQRDREKRFERFVHVYSTGLKDYVEKIEVMDMRYTNGLAVQWKQHDKPIFNGTV